MGIERAVTRWYIQRQAYENEAAALEAKLSEAKLSEMQSHGQESESKVRAEIEKQLAYLQTRLNALGPCPKAMMG
jgi:hypothetical protein